MQIALPPAHGPAAAILEAADQLVGALPLAPLLQPEDRPVASASAALSGRGMAVVVSR